MAEVAARHDEAQPIIIGARMGGRNGDVLGPRLLSASTARVPNSTLVDGGSTYKGKCGGEWCDLGASALPGRAGRAGCCACPVVWSGSHEGWAPIAAKERAAA